MIRSRKLYVASVLGGVLVAVLIVPIAALAQIATPSVATPTADQDTWTSVSYAHLFEVDVDNGGGFPNGVDVEREALLAIVGHRFKLSEDWSLITQGAYQLTSYNFTGDGKGNLPNRPPPATSQALWDEIHQLTLTALFNYRVNDKWSLFALGMYRFSAESGADFGDAMTGGGAGGFQYNWSENLRTGLLVGALSQIKDSAAIVPLPLVTWKMSDSWQFDLGVQTLGAVGYGPEFTWTPNEEWELGLGASYQRRRYRIDGNANSSSNDDGIGDETSMPIFARVGWKPSPTITLDLMGGVAVAGEIRQETDSGSKVFNRDVDPAPILGFEAKFLF